MKNILITGANGFIGKHLSLKLNRLGFHVLSFDINDDEATLFDSINHADFIIHLAGSNRPKNKQEYYDINFGLTKKIVDYLIDNHKNIPLIMSSSIQATLDNEYGKSKLLAEHYLLSSSLPVYIYRLHNVFGKWCRPNYNSAVATFCYNIAHELDIYIRDKDYVLNLNYIDDVVDTFIDTINNDKQLGSKDILCISKTYQCSLGKIANLLYYFKNEIEGDNHLPILHNEFEYHLFTTFCDYLNDNKYPLNYAFDSRGSFEEIYKSDKYGQISINMAYPGITKGGHYHHYKNEIFYTVIGNCEISQINISDDKDVVVDTVSGDNPRLINIKTNYLHEITNTGDQNSYTLMWISEIYNEQKPDTYRLN